MVHPEVERHRWLPCRFRRLQLLHQRRGVRAAVRRCKSRVEGVSTAVTQITKKKCCPQNLCTEFIENIHSLALENQSHESGYEDKDSIIRGSGWSREFRDMTPFTEAIEAGCPVCRILWDAVLCFVPEDIMRPDESRPVRISSERVTLKVIRRAMSPLLPQPQVCIVPETYFGRFNVKLYAPQGGDLCEWPIAPVPSNLRDVSSAAKFERINSWVQNCRENHPTCNSYSETFDEESTPLPNRVLDVLSPKPELRLYETDGERARYICLSHCWGRSQPLTTTRATLEARKREIPWDIVPRLFQDAVTVARKLGIRFLWIDSLCILQDDHDDWVEQSSSMCDIYRNAFLTFAATRCEGSMDTLFPSFQHTVKGHDEKGNPLTLDVRFECLHLFRQDSRYPLLTRGWIFQERLLSRRVIHFGFDELFWECMERTYCECTWISEQTRLFQPLKSTSYRNPKHGLKEEYSSIWHQLVEQFTDLKLTNVSDRQAAILGLAQEMQPSRQGRYLAGLWEDSLLADLGWRLSNRPYGHERPRQEETLAPTWSWASADRQCEYPRNWSSIAGTDGKTSVLSIRDPSPAKFLEDRRALGCLTLKGTLVIGQSKNSPDNFKYHKRSKFDVWFEKSFNSRERRAFFHPDYELWLGSSYHKSAVLDDEPNFYLALGFWETASQKLECGLVLRMVDSDMQLYERIGIVDVELLDRYRSPVKAFDRGKEMVINII